jgi:signal transduction histidine kinase/DNA-binding NarL/FixJ family response regulator
MKDQIKIITSRLVFRITLPTVLLWLILGLLHYFFARHAASVFEVYLATSGVLSGTVIVVVFLVTRSVNRPVKRILHLLASGQKPDYKGVYELECLSGAIGTMMTSLEQLNKKLEDMVQERTQELALAKEKAESATRAKSDFLARMSHEIRTPLNGVIGLTNLVLKSELAPSQKEYLEYVQKSSEHLLNIINDILDFSKIEAGKFELSNRSFSLYRILEKLADMFRLKAAEKQIEIFFFVHEDVPSDLRGDPTRVGQILINLISNAIKFTDKGEVVVQIQLAPEAHRIIGDASTIDLLFSVQDTGIGIPTDKIHVLFKPFTQADGSVDREHEGTGLGLSICQKLVEAMGGRIWLESTVGKGTTFFFTIELKRQTDRAQARLLPSASLKDQKDQTDLKNLAGARILLVEDNETNRTFIVALLSSMGLRVDVSANGRQAVAQLKQSLNDQRPVYDAVLMDIEMPVMDGYTATRIIRSDPLFKQLPIIAMTAHALKGTKRTCLDAGMNDYLAKPVDEQQLSNVLAKFLQPRPPNQQPRLVVEQRIDPDPWDEMPEQIPGIDLRRSLTRIGGNAGLLRKILGGFLEQFSKADQLIRQMLTQGNTDQAKQLVHTIKGAAGNIGAEALFAATRKLERRILEGPGSESAPEMDAFVEHHRRVIDSLAGLDLDQANETALPTESDGPLDVDAIAALLCEVQDLLKKSDSRIRHLLPKLAALVKGTQLRTELRRLDRAVYRLDSDLALKCVSEMNAMLHLPTEQHEESPHVLDG